MEFRQGTVASSRQDWGWVGSEFSSVNFQDARLNHRLIQVASQLADQPSEPINQASQDWAGAKAAYRFFGNSKVDSVKILSAHAQQTLGRMKTQRIVLAVQDTTFLDYSTHVKTQGLGNIPGKISADQCRQGLVMHTSLAMTTDGQPLGILDQRIWARHSEARQGRKVHRELHPKNRESYKWIRGLRRSVQRLRTMDAPIEPSQLVTICDREGDFFELIAEAIQLNTHVLVRARCDRFLERPHVTRQEEPVYLSEWLIQQPVKGHVEVEIPEERQVYPSRKATLEVRFGQTQIPASRQPREFQSKQQYERSAPVSVIWLEEVDPPEGTTSISWVLITTLPVKSLSGAIEKVVWYTRRWQIEVFHRILKSGCRVEACRLEASDKLIRYLTVCSIIAWHLHWLTYENRKHPEQPCTQVLTEAEWKALYSRIHKTHEIPEHPPTLRQALRWIGQLGGFLGRKCDGEPGPTTLWRGWQRLADISTTWELLNPQRICG